MKVILLKNAPNIGKEGETKEVKSGYARNYLIPQKIALEATSANVNSYDQLKKKHAKEVEKHVKEAEHLKTVIEKISVTLPVEIKDGEEIYGSITAQHVVNALKKEGVDINKQCIHLTDSIHTTGVYSVDIKLHPSVNAVLKVWVVKK